MFQGYINAIFKDLINNKIVLTYMDNLIVPLKNLANGVRKLKSRVGGLSINWKKCKFLESSIKFIAS